MRLAEKVAVVTGAASGIGLAVAQKLLAEGAKVVLSDINNYDLELLGEKKDNAWFVKCDTSKPTEVDALLSAAVEKFGRLDVMVNNAGIGLAHDLLGTSDEEWRKVLDINLSGVFYGLKKAAQIMQELKIKGSIINMSSILGTVGMQGAIAYCAAKGGVVQLTRAAALDLAAAGIRVNAIAPGFIQTNMTKDVLADEQFNQFIKMSTPLGYVGEPADIANAALYLASDEAKYVTGIILHVDGGWTAK